MFYKFIAFPVVDEHGKLVGIARANDFIEDTMALEEKTEHERDDLLKLKRLVLYEVLVGAKIGLLCGGVLYAVSFFWIGNQSFSITLSLTILLTLVTASFLGCSLPILFKVQIPLIILTALSMRVNLPAAIAASWITNPLTAPVVYPLQYRLGLWLTGAPTINELAGYTGMLRIFFRHAKPLWVGSLLSATFCALVAYTVVLVTWEIIDKFRKKESDHP